MNSSTAIPSMLVARVTDVSAQNAACKIRQVRPWVRYFARMTDLFLFSCIAGILLGLCAPSMAELPSSLLTVVILFAWIFQESVLLANCGTTPGKWLFKITVRNREGRKLTFSEALNRSFGVWLKGMGAGIPLISFITLLSSRSTLKRDGVTTWDQEGGFVVTHGKIGMLRSAMAAMILFGFGSLGTLDDASEETYDVSTAPLSIENRELLVEPAPGIATDRSNRYDVQSDPRMRESVAQLVSAYADNEAGHDEVNVASTDDPGAARYEAERPTKPEGAVIEATNVKSAVKPVESDNGTDQSALQELAGLAEKWLEEPTSYCQ